MLTMIVSAEPPDLAAYSLKMSRPVERAGIAGALRNMIDEVPRCIFGSERRKTSREQVKFSRFGVNLNRFDNLYSPPDKYRHSNLSK